MDRSTTTDDSDKPRAGRTITSVDDVITRVMGRVPLAVALLFAGVVYGGIGLALPLALHASAASLVGLNVIGATWAWTLTLGWLFPVIEARARRELLEQTTNLRLLSAREFEQLVGELLRREGWVVEEVGGHGKADGGIDLRVRRGDRRTLVQCKRWQSWQVGVEEVRQLAGAMLREGLRRGSGMLVTLSDFSPAAAAEAKMIGIDLIAGPELVLRLENVGATDILRNDTRDLPYGCPQCGTPMVLRHSRHGYWLSCPHYATDKGKLDLGTDPKLALERLIRSR
jgi:restriction system protein